MDRHLEDIEVAATGIQCKECGADKDEYCNTPVLVHFSRVEEHIALGPYRVERNGRRHSR